MSLLPNEVTNTSNSIACTVTHIKCIYAIYGKPHLLSEVFDK
jgi:hypothetical protein